MLRGNKVILDTIDPENIEWLRNQRNKPEMRKYFREWKDISKDQQAKWYATRGNNSDQNHVYFEVRDIMNNEIIGCTGLHYIDWRLRSAEFGIFLCEESRGDGKGTETLSMLFDFGFNEMNLHKIWAEVYDSNDAINLYRKIGMKDDGILRDNYFRDGKYGNSIMLSVIENEWRHSRGK